VAKVDQFLALSEQSRQAFLAFVLIPEFEMVLADQHVQGQADVFAADRIDVAFDPQQAVGFDRDLHRRAGVEPLRRQRIQGIAFLPERIGPFLVSPGNDLPDESQILGLVVEVAVTTQPQGLVQPGFQMAVRGLDVAVLVRLADVDPVTLQAVVIEQPLVLRGEALVTGKVVDGRRQAVAADPAGDAACGVQGVLQPCRQGLERLRVAEMDVFPIGIGEDGMKQQVVVLPSLNRDPQLVQDHEVKGDHVARMMNLRESDFLFDAILQLPLLNSPLQRAPHRTGDHDLPCAAGRGIVFLFQPVKQGKGTQPRIVLQERLDLGPIRLDGILAGPIVPRRPLLLARQHPALAITPDRSFAHLKPPCNLRHRNLFVEQ